MTNPGEQYRTCRNSSLFVNGTQPCKAGEEKETSIVQDWLCNSSGTILALEGVCPFSLVWLW